MIFLRPRLKEFRFLKLSCLWEHTLSLDSFLKSRRFIFLVPTLFVLGICNAETSANKDTFKQLGDIFQCICINRRSLIHIFPVPECLTLTLRQWELSFLFMLFISTKHAWGEEMNVFWGLCDCGDAAWAVQGTERVIIQNTACLWLSHVQWAHTYTLGVGGIWALLKPLIELFIKSS